MRKTTYYIIIIVFALILTDCKEPFEPRTELVNPGYVVAEGYIDLAENAVTQIKLSRTTPISEEAYYLPEEGALMCIEDQYNNSYPLNEQDAGRYISDTLSLKPDKSYRLKITLTSGKVILSEFIEPILTPEIDSVTWVEFPEGVQIYVSTNDPENKIKYYQWTYEEVWERTVPLDSYVKFQNGRFVLRTPEETAAMKNCWVYNRNANIITTPSEKYVQGIIPQKEILFFPRLDERLFIRYNVTVTQLALSESTYNFLEILKKNGSLGSFSDPMPAELPSNLYSLNDSEPVIGFIGATNTQTKRLEIWADDVTDWNGPPIFCYEGGPGTAEQYAILQIQNAFLLTYGYDTVGDSIITAFWAWEACVDCRLVVGAGIKPSFWN